MAIPELETFEVKLREAGRLTVPKAVRDRLHAVASAGGLPIFAKLSHLESMSTMNISLPDSLKAFVDEQVTQGGHGTSSECVRELIRTVY
jgi:hypothetical protein